MTEPYLGVGGDVVPDREEKGGIKPAFCPAQRITM